MRVEYNLTKKDVVASVQWTRRRLWGPIRTWILNSPILLTLGFLNQVFAGGAAAGFQENHWKDPYMIFLLVTLIIGGALCLWIWAWNKNLPTHIFTTFQHCGMTEELSSEITPEGIRVI